MPSNLKKRRLPLMLKKTQRPGNTCHQKKGTKSRIGDLYKDEERTVRTTTDKEKANTLLDKFLDVFVTEKRGELPTLSPKNVPRLDKVETTHDMIWKVI